MTDRLTKDEVEWMLVMQSNADELPYALVQAIAIIDRLKVLPVLPVLPAVEYTDEWSETPHEYRKRLVARGDIGRDA